MQRNLNNPNFVQYFEDTTYYYVLPHNKGMKLFILLGFYNNVQKKNNIISFNKKRKF